VRALALPAGARVLDLATGTGDLAIDIARMHPDARVVGLDPSPQMLAVAAAKLARHALSDRVTLVRGDAQQLAFATGEMDAATIAFGIRNVPDRPAALREMARVVRPGGRVVILEITTPTRPPVSTFLEIWFDRIIPALGRLAGDRDAYTYLPNSVRRFPAPEGLAAAMWRAGLRDVRYRITAGGIIALHVGVVPG
jgi:demethylmenaquinone methyltransferase/2-methoxy-6-polyprenyl-1,4-benzoquinol methylase